MADETRTPNVASLVVQLRHWLQVLRPDAGEVGSAEVGSLRALLTRVETSTPGGAPLHAQLDNVRKWLDALDRPEDHPRFGGAAHLRSYLLTQVRLALGALEDYQRATQ